MKGTIRLSLDPISTLVYVALLILTIYNIRLSWNLAKLKSSVAVKPFESLSSLELNEIEKINVTAGQLVSPNQTILKLADTTQQMIQFNAFEEDANKLLTSDSLIVTFNTDPTTHYSLKIAKIIKDDNHHISVSATIDTIQHRKYSRKPAGQTKGIVTDAANGSYNHFFIPTASIYVDKKKKETSVWVVDVKTQTISRRKVICSKKSKSGLTEIYKGVKENEMVIDTQYKSLKEGQKVMIKP